MRWLFPATTRIGRGSPLGAAHQDGDGCALRCAGSGAENFRYPRRGSGCYGCEATRGSRKRSLRTKCFLPALIHMLDVSLAGWSLASGVWPLLTMTPRKRSTYHLKLNGELRRAPKDVFSQIAYAKTFLVLHVLYRCSINVGEYTYLRMRPG